MTRILSPDAASRVQTLGTALTIGTVAWGALTFGAVYPWGYGVLAVLAGSAGAVGLLGPGAAPRAPAEAGTRGRVSLALVVSLLSVAGAAMIQLIPLPLSAVTALNPNAIDVLRQYDPAFALNPGSHALSVWPRGTVTALLLFTSCAVLLVGVTRSMSIAGARRLVEWLIVTGVILALIGIVQRPIYAGKIYGFWTPNQGGNPFGPFVNRNHFAGWMLMVVPVALGYVCGGLARGLRGVKPEWRYRLLWLSSPDANKLILVSTGTAVMALAVVLTLSRSGISALALALGITGWFSLRRLPGWGRKTLAAAYLVLLVVLAVGVVGEATLATRFAAPDWADFNGRSGAWADAVATFRRHWLTGTGLNTYQVVNLFYQQHGKEAFVSSAHNDYLQLAAEGGLLLIVPIAFCIVLFVRDVRRRLTEDRGSSAYWLRVGAVTGLLAIALQETSEFSLQIPGNAALFAVVCALALHKSPGRMTAR